jgi:hypothetical protein
MQHSQRALLLLLWVTISTKTIVAIRSKQQRGERWQELLPSLLLNDLDADLEEENQKKSPRRLLWYGKADDYLTMQEEKTVSKKKPPTSIEHPLRNDLWKLNISWFFQKAHSRKVKVDFKTNGYCKLFSEKEVLGIGTWRVFPWGVWFCIAHKNGYDYTFYAGFHLNPFGNHPKLVQGTILKCPTDQLDEVQDSIFLKRPRRKWFRPVVGTFSGIGIGEDTIDLSYSKRGHGLTSPQ